MPCTHHCSHPAYYHRTITNQRDEPSTDGGNAGMKQVAIYARVSSEQQAEAGTIDSQVSALRERVEQDGYPCLMK